MLYLKKQGENPSLVKMEEKIRKRDQVDSSRGRIPLKETDNARELNNTQMSIAQQVQSIYNWVLEV